jgi:beta-galactosidase GanA
VFLFLHNFAAEERTVDLGAARYADAIDGALLTGRVKLPAYASRVIEKRG